MSEWQTVQLGDVALLNPKERLQRGDIAPFISMADVGEDCAGVLGVGEKSFNGGGARFRTDDTLIARITPCLQNGKIAKVPNLGDGVTGFGSTEFVVLRGDNVNTDTKFLHGLAQMDDFREYAVRHMSGSSGRQRVSRDSLAIYRFPLPPLEEQRRIASVLGTFDDLIERQRTNAQMADELWRTVVRLSISDDADWVPLSSLADFVNGRNFTKDANGEGLPVIRTPEVRTGPTESTIYNDVETDQTRIAEPGDILFVWSGSLMASRWSWGRGLINQHVFKVIPGKDTPDWLVMFAVEELMDDFLRVAADKATTMGHIKRSNLDSCVATPRPHEWNRLDRVVRPLWDEALSAREHIADLTRTRDELLPLLMSGKVRVEDVDLPKGVP